MTLIHKKSSIIFVSVLLLILYYTQTSSAAPNTPVAKVTNAGVKSTSQGKLSETNTDQIPIHRLEQSKRHSPLLLLTEEEELWLQDHRRIRFSGPRAFPPFHFFDEDSRAQGIAADYFGLICDLLQVTPEVQSDLFWPEVLQKTKDKEIDLISISAKSVEREKYLLFTEPFLSFPLVIITKNNAPFVGSMDFLHDQKIALVEGNVIYDWILKDKINVIPYFVKTPLEALQAVSSGEAYAAIENLAATTFLLLHNGLTNLKIAAPTHYKNYDLSIAVRNDWPELVSILNKALSVITPKQHSEILNRWLSVRYEHGISKTDVIIWILAVITIFAGILAIIALWNRKLQREINERKRTEHILSESEARFKALHNASFGGIAIHDKGIILECNQGLVNTTKSVLSFVPPTY